jgi:hypothetical protein
MLSSVCVLMICLPTLTHVWTQDERPCHVSVINAFLGFDMLTWLARQRKQSIGVLGFSLINGQVILAWHVNYVPRELSRLSKCLDAYWHYNRYNFKIANIKIAQNCYSQNVCPQKGNITKLLQNLYNYLFAFSARLLPLLSHPLLLYVLENIGSVYPFYVYDCNRPFAPILSQRWCSLMYDVYWLA